MKVAITIWNSRVSPVFDTAARVLVLDIVNGSETGRMEVAMTDVYPPLRVQRLKSQGVDLLICGAVCNATAALITSAGIELIPWVSGETDEVLKAFKEGDLPSPRFAMPGCRRRLRHRGADGMAGAGRRGGLRGNRGPSRRGDIARGMWMKERLEHDEKEGE